MACRSVQCTEYSVPEDAEELSSFSAHVQCPVYSDPVCSQVATSEATKPLVRYASASYVATDILTVNRRYLS